MLSGYHHFCELFAQLGLPSTAQDVQSFINTHAPLPGDTRLQDASFWSPSQATLLSEWIQEDADWTALVDRLDVALRV